MTNDIVIGSNPRSNLGAWSLVCGLASLVGVLMIGQATFDWISFHPPGWMRIVTAWMLPIGAVAAFVLGGMALARRSQPALAVVGFVLALASIGGFVAMILSVDY